jgi:hypothetical protein
MPSLEAMALRHSELAAQRDTAIASLSARTGVTAPTLAPGAPKPLTPAVLNQAQLDSFMLDVIAALAVEVDALKGAKKGGK